MMECNQALFKLIISIKNIASGTDIDHPKTASIGKLSYNCFLSYHPSPETIILLLLFSSHCFTACF